MFSTMRLAVSQLVRTWRLLGLLAFGLLLTSVIACIVPLFNSFLAGTQLQHALETSDIPARNVAIRANSVSTDTFHAALDAQVRALAPHYLSSFTESQPFYNVFVQNLTLVREGPAPAVPLSSSPNDTKYANLEATDFAVTAHYMQMVAGRLPQSPSADGIPEVLITEEMATQENLTVGDEVVVAQSFAATQTITGRIVGIWTPRNASDPFWNGFSFKAIPPFHRPPLPPQYPVYMNPADLFSSISGISGQNLWQEWSYITAPQRITSANMASVVSNVQTLESSVAQQLQFDTPTAIFTVSSKLDRLIQDTQNQYALFDLPLYLVAIPAIGLTLLFVASIAIMLVEAESQEIATLKSRGLSVLQLLSTYILQVLPLAILASLAAPVFAGLVAFILLRAFQSSETFSKSGITLQYLAGLVQPGTTTAIAGAAVLVGLYTLLLTAWQAARLDVLAFRREQGRFTHEPFWRRYYLDVALAGLCALGYLELGQFGGTATRIELGSGANSPFLLIAPSLLLLAGALLLLRLIPISARLGQRLAARRRGLIGQLAFASIERSPRRYSRVVLFLALAVGLGLLAINYDVTLTQNIQDRVGYSTGADMRLRLLSTTAQGDALDAGRVLATLPGVSAISPAYHDQEVVSINGVDEQADMLGVDPSSFGRVAASSWRQDYASLSLPQLMHMLSAPPTGAQKEIPALIDDRFAQDVNLKIGDGFTVTFPQAEASDTHAFSQAHFVVVGFVHEFPTMYPTDTPLGFLVTNLDEVVTAINASPYLVPHGINEYWLSTSSSPKVQQALVNTLGEYTASLNISQIFTRQQALASAESNPLNGGMSGILFTGAAIAAVLALLETVVQSALTARQRSGQFALLRTFGMTRRQLGLLLLGEQSAVFIFGLVGGTLLGLILTTATLPFLQFSDTSIDPATIGVPPYQLVFNLPGIALFYIGQLLACLIALFITGRYANSLGLGRSLRIGED